MSNQIILPRQLDANGNPASGAKATTFESNTTTPLTVYTDTALSVAHANPIVANAQGYFPQAFMDGTVGVKIVVTDASDAALVTYDPAPVISLSLSNAADISFSPTTAVPATDIQTAIEQVQSNADAIETDILNSKTGVDAGIISGTAGAENRLGQFNADGDLVEGPAYGTSGNNTLVQTNGSGQLPAIDGSQLTNVLPGARAWVMFDGRGTVSIIASYNVDSVVRNAGGVYTITFTEALPSANFATLVSCNRVATDGYAGTDNTRTTTSVVVRTYEAGNLTDQDEISVLIFG